MSLETGVVIGLIVSVLLVVGVGGMLWWDGLFTEATDWINTDDPKWIVETREPVSFKTPATKGFQARNGNVVPMRDSQLPRRATK